MQLHDSIFDVPSITEGCFTIGLVVDIKVVKHGLLLEHIGDYSHQYIQAYNSLPRKDNTP